MSKSHRSRVAVEIPGNPALFQPEPMAGWEVLGIVADAAGAGALVRNLETGMYCLANAGVLRSLPQSKVKAAVTAAAAHQKGGAAPE